MTNLHRRLLVLVLLSLGLALLLVDYVRLPAKAFEEGQVADRDIRAPTSFHYVDWDRTAERQKAAEAAVRIVFDYDTTVSIEGSRALESSFSRARQSVETVRRARALESVEDINPVYLQATLDRFVEVLPFARELPVSVREELMALRWGAEVQAETLRLFDWAMAHYLVLSDERIPEAGTTITLHHLEDDREEDLYLDTLADFLSVSDARDELWRVSNESAVSDEVQRVSVALTMALVRENLIYNHALTESDRRQAREQVKHETIRVGRGTVIVREGDVIDRHQARTIEALQTKDSGVGQLGITVAFMTFCALLLGVVYQFGRGFIKKFSTRPRDLAAVGLIMFLVISMARIDVEVSVSLSTIMGLGTSPTTFWYALPFAGGAMLVRILVNSETALLWILVSSVLCGMVMEQQVLYTVFFMASGLSAAAALSHGSERVGVLKAGVLAGLINAALVILINLVRAHMGDIAVVGPAAATQPVWDVALAFTGGVFSGFLVLGLLPLFELGGFVTDYKLLELANLNHPLLRQLMLKAPGTYHHSVTVAQLCEAAAESIGANALQTRVACYFHDIGKSLQPQYYIENQRGGLNPHDRLPPRTSARIIVSHAVDGAAIARQYNLPQPIIDGITQHHGTGLISFFYSKAVEQAQPGEVVDESDFRYPGELPSSRETGILMLADRVEAACRTLPDKSADSIRGLIQKLVNSSITDGQLEQCPLTVKELYTVVDAFTETLLGIYHQRIEYPGLPPRPAQPAADTGEQSTAPIITLEVANPLRETGTLPRSRRDEE
jgi:putative nucleotidyltransferase with HDIG domain